MRIEHTVFVKAKDVGPFTEAFDFVRSNTTTDESKIPERVRHSVQGENNWFTLLATIEDWCHIMHLFGVYRTTKTETK